MGAAARHGAPSPKSFEKRLFGQWSLLAHPPAESRFLGNSREEKYRVIKSLFT